MPKVDLLLLPGYIYEQQEWDPQSLLLWPTSQLPVTPNDDLCAAIKWITLVLTSTFTLKKTRASGRNIGKVSNPVSISR